MDNRRLQFLHSSTSKSKFTDGERVTAVMKDVDTGETFLKIIDDPMRKVYITKNGLREEDQNDKLLCVPIDDCDMYTIPNWDIKEQLQKIVKGYSTGYIRISDLMNDYNVFGGVDIPIQVLIKQHTYNLHKAIASDYRVGGFDIETNIVPDTMFASSAPGDEIIIINYVTPDLKIYSGVLSKFVEKYTKEYVINKIKTTLPVFRDNLNEKARGIYDTFTPELHYKVFDTEPELFRWIFDNIHMDKPDYVMIWNMSFDIPRILERMEALHLNPRDYFCHPDIPRRHRVFNYRQDNNKNLQHVSHAWHVVEASGYTGWLDAMCLYSRLRKHKGVEDSYSLEAITTKFLGTGKLQFEEAGHYVMQTERQDEYCAYGVIDSILLVLLECINKDIVQLHTLMAYSDLPSFAHQTVQLRDRFFDYCKHRNLVPASRMGKVEYETDASIVNVGGNVLEPGLAWRTGVNKVAELHGKVDNVVSKLQYVVLDLDVTSEYPSLARALNICKDTKVLTLLGIEGFNKTDIVDFCGHLLAAKENAVYLCNKYLNLPDYKEMGELFDTHNNQGVSHEL